MDWNIQYVGTNVLLQYFRVGFRVGVHQLLRICRRHVASVSFFKHYTIYEAIMCILYVMPSRHCMALNWLPSITFGIGPSQIRCRFEWSICHDIIVNCICADQNRKMDSHSNSN